MGQSNKALHLTAIPLRSIAAGELHRYHAQWTMDYLHSLHLYSDPRPSF